MRKIAIIISSVVLISILGCKIDNYYHKPGGPYYFKSGITYQGMRPSGEITQAEAKELEKNKYAFYIAYFNSEGKPTIIEKYHEGKLINKYELFYENNKHIKTIITDENGNQNTQHE